LQQQQQQQQQRYHDLRGAGFEHYNFKKYY
jgi:hypothetical protein